MLLVFVGTLRTQLKLARGHKESPLGSATRPDRKQELDSPQVVGLVGRDLVGHLS